MHGPQPNTVFPFNGEHHIVFIKNVVSGPNIEVGDYSYYSDMDGAEDFQKKCVSYHFDFIGDRLVIGKFCALATGVEFIMNGASHVMSGLSTYPFNIFQNGWEAEFDPTTYQDGNRGDTVIGNDVWIGNGATIMPGVKVGHGAIIGAKAVVAKDVADYAIVAGNPAREVRRRFSEKAIEALLEIAWWDWPVEKITANLPLIRGGDVDALRAISST
ncbi:MAG: CatB-related O-acetyltransferase [Rhodobacteraceae bacterium]|nr:CatB-related O-acetyltransferase [Paracoccaceae bacterium]